MEDNDLFVVLYYDICEDNLLKLENLLNESIEAKIKVKLCMAEYQDEFFSSHSIKLLLKNDFFNKLFSEQNPYIYLCDKNEEKYNLENSLAIFYLTKKKGKYFTENFMEIMELKKLIIFEEMDKYKSILNVIKKFKSSNDKYVFKNPKFYNYYGFLEGSDEINELYNKVYEERNKSIYYVPPIVEEQEEKKEEISYRFIKKVNKEKKYEEEEKKIIYEKKKNEEDENNKIKNVVYTYYIETNDSITNDIQRGCILENCRNKSLDIIYIYVDDNDKRNYLDCLLKDKLNEENYRKITFILNETYGIYNIMNVIKQSNKDHDGDIIYILRSDTIIPYQESIDNIYFEFLDNVRKVYGISRVERNLNGHMYKDEMLGQLFYATSQDMFIYNSPLKVENKEEEIINFYEENSELLINKMLEYNDYEVMNDTTNYKLIRILGNDKERYIMKKMENKKNEENEIQNKYKYNPENNGLESIPIEHFFKQLDEKEILYVKQHIFNKYIMKKINMSKKDL